MLIAIYAPLILLPLSGLAQTMEVRDLRPDYYAESAALEEYIETALEQNPAVFEARARYLAAIQRIAQVSALPDPMLNVTQAVQSVESRVGPQLNSYSLSQRFPWFGKLDLAGDIAELGSEAVYQLYLGRQRDVIAQVKRSYYELGYVDRVLAIAEEERALLEHYETLAQSRYGAGQGLLQAVIKLQAEITRLVNRIEVLRQQRATLATRLNTLMDREPGAPVPPVEPLPLPAVTLVPETLYELGLANREELKAAQALIERSETAIDLAQKQYWPDLTVSAAFINVGERSGLTQPLPENGKNVFNVTLGLNIPIWRDKYEAGVLEAAEERSAQRSNYANLVNEMEFSVRDQVIRLETLGEQVRLFENVLIPQAREALRSTESAYETGQVDVLSLLDSERVLLDVRLANARFYSDYLQALANLERALGTKFPKE